MDYYFVLSKRQSLENIIISKAYQSCAIVWYVDKSVYKSVLIKCNILHIR